MQGPEAPGCHKAAAVSREHVIKGLTCQAQKFQHDLKQQGVTEGCHAGQEHSCRGGAEGLKSKLCASGATSAQRDCSIVRKVPAAAASGRRVAWQGAGGGTKGTGDQGECVGTAQVRRRP